MKSLKSALVPAIQALDRTARDLRAIAVAHPHLKVVATLKGVEDVREEICAVLRETLKDGERIEDVLGAPIL